MTEMPGLQENAFQLKSLSDAVALRDHAIEMLEVADATDNPDVRRSLLHFVVVGGNFSGVEVAGELEAFLRQAAGQYTGFKPADISITLVEHSDRLLGALDADLADYALKNLRSRGLEVLLKTGVVAVGPDFAQLSTGAKVPSRTVVWCAGVAPTPLTFSLPVPRDERGYIQCERDLRVKGFDNIWAIGDCADNPGPDGQSYPATAQHAVQQARHVGPNIARVLRGEPTRPCDIHTKGWLAAMGCRTGVARVMGIKVSGFFAWWLWRTVYLMKTPGWGRRVRVAIEWTLELFFRRDYVQLGAHERDRAPARAAGQSSTARDGELWQKEAAGAPGATRGT
jgi:NADH dehydrogenase